MSFFESFIVILTKLCQMFTIWNDYCFASRAICFF